MSRLLPVTAALLGIAVVVEGVALVDARDRLAALESRPAPIATAPLQAHRAPQRERQRQTADDDDAFFAGDRPAVRAPRDEQRAAPADEAAPERMQRLVREELQRIDDEREAGREERRRGRVQERAQGFAAAHRLNAQQQDTLTSVLVAEHEEVRATFREARESDSIDGVRERVAEIRKRSDDNMRAVLDADQMTAFQAMRAEDGGPGGGGGRRRGVREGGAEQR